MAGQHSVRICIWFATTEGPWGGANQFLRALTSELRRLGHEVTPEPRRGDDVVLLNAFVRGPGTLLRPREIEYARRAGTAPGWSRFVPMNLSRRLSRTRTTFVHRLDGVSHLIRGGRSQADDVHVAVNALCDYTIFQSRYCVSSFRERGDVSPRHATTIYNGVDGTVFAPPENPLVTTPRTIRFGASSWSPNPRKGFAHIAELSLVPGVEVEFAGRWPEAIDAKNVRLVGAKDSRALAEWLRTLDAMVHAAENEPCSNAILEGLASGLPMLYLDSGGNRELAGDYGVPISGEFRHDVSELRERYAELRQRVLDSREKFLIGCVAREYVRAFEEAIRLRGGGAPAA